MSVEMRGDSDPQMSSKAQEILERRREAQKRVAQAQRRAAEEKAEADLTAAEAAAATAAEKAAAEKLAAERAAAEKAAKASIALAPKPAKWEPLPDLPLVKRANNPFGLSFTVDIKTTTVEERRRRRERDEMTPRPGKTLSTPAAAGGSEVGGKPPLSRSTSKTPSTKTGMHLTAGVGGFRFSVDFKRMLKVLPRPVVRPVTRFELPVAPARMTLPRDVHEPLMESGLQIGPTFQEVAAEQAVRAAKTAAQLAAADEKTASALADAAEWRAKHESSEDKLADALAMLAAEEARRHALELELSQTKNAAEDVEKRLSASLKAAEAAVEKLRGDNAELTLGLEGSTIKIHDLREQLESSTKLLEAERAAGSAQRAEFDKKMSGAQKRAKDTEAELSAEIA